MIDHEAGSPGATGILETFMSFPSPLALLDLHGRIEVVNRQFSEHLERAEIDPQSLAGFARADDIGWQPLPPMQAGGDPVLRGRAVKTPHRLLVIAEVISKASAADGYQALQARIQELEQIAATDPVTGAWTRVHLEHVIASEMARSTFSRQPLSLILLDIDQFQSIEGRYGRDVGNALLSDLVKLIKSCMRTSDLLFRWGEQEFAILVSSAGYRGAETLAQKLRRAVEKHDFPQIGQVTFSLGVAEYFDNEAAPVLFARLEAALHAARNKGRNRVVVDRCGNTDAWAAGSSALHLIWQEGYESGNATIDDEHRKLFALANKLIDVSLEKTLDKASFLKALDALIVHVQHHFADEEEILERYCYAQLAEQRRSHAGLVQRALRFQELAESGEISPGGIIEFLAHDVVARHLRIVDRGFFSLFSRDGD